MVYKVLTDEDRRRLILEAIGPNANISKIAREYGINRSTVHKHVNRAVKDPDRTMRDAEAEADFRRKAYEMTR
jgi:transposase-like protein